jgi:HEPN domain-containing protein
MTQGGAREWLVLANEDLAMAEYAMAGGIFRQACFHAQQAAEKALKGFLVARAGAHAKSHSLEQLLFSDPGVHDELQPWRERLRRLDGFYLATRYADAISLEAGEPTREEARASLDDAKGIVAEITVKIGGGP